jgi:YbbR domain-containing protein
MPGASDTYPEKRPAGVMLKHIFRKVFLEDWVMKVVALAITLALWLGVTGLSTPTTELIRNVPLNLRFSSDIAVTGTELQQVDVIVSGDKRRVSQMNRGDLVVSVDLTDVEPGERVVNLTPENVLFPLPTGIKLDEILPGAITVKLEPVIERNVPVTIETSGEPADGFEIYAHTPVPAEVRVRGPAGYVQTLDQLRTELIDVTDRRADFTAATVQLNRPGWDKVILLKGAVDVNFRIGETRSERVLLVNIGDTDRKATVVLFGPRSVLASLRPESLSVTTSQDDKGEEVPQIVLPEYLRRSVEVRQIRLRP